MRLSKATTGILRCAAPLALALVASCDLQAKPGGILSVQTPDIVSPSAISSAAGATAELNGAYVAFGTEFGGGLAYNTIDGLFTDQITSGRQQLNFVQQRAWDLTQIYEIYYFWIFQERAERAIAAVKQFEPTVNISELYAQLGIFWTIVGETTCNGFAVGHLLPGGSPTYETGLTSAVAYTRALAYFDSSAAANPSPNVTNLIQVGRARTYLDQAATPTDPKVAQAVAAVATVPTSFFYNATYTSLANNGLSQWVQQSGNFGVADTIGTNGLNYLSSGDPRVGAFAGARARFGQDGTTPIYFMRQASDPAQPQVVASGTEARLIEAEAALAAGNPAWLTDLNNLRTANPPWPGQCYISPTAVAPCPALAGNLTDPGTASGRVDLVFRERAFWMYLTAHRTGDYRRLIHQYGRAKDSVYPTGSYFHGGTYGTYYTMPVTQHDWSLIPNYNGCTDYNP